MELCRVRRCLLAQANQSNPLANHCHEERRPRCKEPARLLAQTPFKPDLQITKASFNSCFEVADASINLRVEFRQALFELGIEPGEIELVDVSEIRSVSGVHSMKVRSAAAPPKARNDS